LEEVPKELAAELQRSCLPIGNRVIRGIQTEGCRTTVPFPGMIGAVPFRAMAVEVWRSTAMQLTLQVQARTSSSPLQTIYEITNIRTSEPDPKLFDVPSGYTAIEEPSTFRYEYAKPTVAKTVGPRPTNKGKSSAPKK
jgi:hypothetical protein